MPRIIKCPSCGTLAVNYIKEQCKSSIRIHSIFRLKMMSIQLILTIFLLFIGICYGCNVDTTKPIRYEGDAGDEYFGYTVLQYENFLRSTYVFIGAPKGNSSHQATLTRPGKVYKCFSSSPTCEQVNLDNMGNAGNSSTQFESKDNQWLGVSLSAQPLLGGLISACGHRYHDDYFDYYAGNSTAFIGVCYNFIYGVDIGDIKKIYPCLDGNKWLGCLEAGIDSTILNNTELYGAPVKGNVVSGNTNNNFSEDESGFKPDYTGYAVTAGHFIGPNNDQQGVAGAPRAKGLGKVIVYEIDNGTVYQEIYGEPRFTYFGSALASIDLNNDGLSDLLVGAPLYSNDQDEGKVYVYLNNGSQDEPLKLAQEIQGMKAFRARFGTSINGCGDINKDGYSDVIIGAPYEDDGTGAIYIYLGAKDGVYQTYSQRISGSLFEPPVRTFGISVYGGIDMDHNDYPDILVGAYESDTAFLFKTKPIVKLQAWLEFDPLVVNPDMKNCSLNGRDYACLNVKVCFQFSGITPTFTLDIVYSIDVDEENTTTGIDSRFFLTDEKLIRTNGTLAMSEENIKTCDESNVVTAYLSDKAKNFLTPVPMKLSYDVFDYTVETVRGDVPPSFPQGIPPVSNSYDCGAQYITEEITFVQNCGRDSICTTDIELNVEAELSGNKEELILGASPTLYINAKIDNNGEDAHQAILKVHHPSDMGYEGVELKAVTCLGENCRTTAEVVATCLPKLGQDANVILECSLGNPMKAYNSATLRLRFDVSNISISHERQINITMIVYTVSKETEEEKANNVKQLKFPVIVEADMFVVGVSQPESVYYGYTASSFGKSDQQAADQFKLERTLEAVKLFYKHNKDASRYNQSHIGPAFNLEFQVVNNGPGRLPLTSNVTIKIPRRNADGGILMFIKSIMIDENVGLCNEDRLVKLQRDMIRDLERGSSVTYYAEDSKQQLETASNSRQLGCDKVNCIDLYCTIFPLKKKELVKITVKALLWEYTFVTRQYEMVEIVSEGIVESDDPFSIHRQPDEHEPNSIKIHTVAYTSTIGQKPVSWWVILLSIILGILLLVGIVFGLWKKNFFKRPDKSYKDKAAVNSENDVTEIVESPPSPAEDTTKHGQYENGAADLKESPPRSPAEDTNGKYENDVTDLNECPPSTAEDTNGQHKIDVTDLKESPPPPAENTDGQYENDVTDLKENQSPAKTTNENNQ